MDRRLGWIALALIPPMAGLFHLLSLTRHPLTGYLIGMGVYWLLLIAALVWRGCWPWRIGRPALWTVLGFAALLGLALWMGRDCLDRLSPLVMAAVVASALLNGFLEEGFWRGALIPGLGRGDWGRALAPLGLFVLWHLAPMAGQGRIAHACNDVNMLLAAALLGVPAMGARLSSGSAGAGALGHAALNLAAFWIIAAHPPA